MYSVYTDHPITRRAWMGAPTLVHGAEYTGGSRGLYARRPARELR